MADKAWARPHPALELGLQTPRSAFATVFLVNKTLEEEDEEDLEEDFDGPQSGGELKTQIFNLFPDPPTTTTTTTISIPASMSLRPECVIEQNTNFRGFNIEGSAEVENVEACAILSAETEDASYWTYVTSTKLCW